MPARTDSLDLIALTPAGLLHAGAALAAARAGAVGMLDLVFCPAPERASAQLDGLLAAAPPAARLGLRVAVGRPDDWTPLAARLRENDVLLLAGGDGAARAASVAAARALTPASLLAEAADEAEVAALAAAGPALAGIVGVGSECGGPVGEASAFVLMQRLLACAGGLPVWVRGGMGPNAAAACLAAGAVGVVLGDELLLMPDSPLPLAWRALLAECGAHDTVTAGERHGAAVRFVLRPGLAAARRLQRLDRALEAGEEEGGAPRWRAAAAAAFAWGPPDEAVWPVGQGVSLAARLRDRYRGTGRLVRALREGAPAQLRRAAAAPALAAGAPLAEALGTRFPVVQGPMTRVSDSPAFARAVADAGALPVVALALLPADRVRALLRETGAAMEGRPWGVGVLGFVPAELKAGHMREIAAARPPFAVVAGGRPDDARALDAAGVATFLHVPVPSLLASFVRQGARRFVLEGYDCGGHVGPLSPFVLWEEAVDVLCREVPADERGAVQVLFAGGIHDARSAAAVSALAAPLAEVGMAVGVLMGTAYLATREIVEAGALAPGFQQAALACRGTVRLQSGVGHANRCAATGFADEFAAERARLLARRTPPDRLRESLDRLLLGRLRIAARGQARDEGGALVPVDAATQAREGMYMMGEVAALCTRVRTVEELHLDVAEGSAARLAQAAGDGRAEEAEGPAPAPADVAIIGMAVHLPGGASLEEYWHTLLARETAVTEIPADRWDWRLLYDPDPRARDRVVSRWGGFFRDLPFDPLAYGVPPASMPGINPAQLLALELSRRALEDAGYGPGEAFDRAGTATIFAHSDAGGLLGNLFVTRATLPLLEGRLGDDPAARLPEWTEESFTGLLTNIAAGRVANRLDLGGTNLTVDAACASSAMAVDLAVRELESGRAGLALAGAVDIGQSPFFYLAFSKTQALSPTGRARVFDQDADGIVLSEGAAVLVLKRLADAERDGDRVYAVIKGVGTGSDGRGLGMTAPRPAGQLRALRRAYGRAGFGPERLGMYEAHGTGTPVGDRAELETVDTLLREAGAAPGACALGSAKSLIGHTKVAAGAAGLVKAALGLYHGVLPPHAGVDRPLAPLRDPRAPLVLLDEPRPWLEGDAPRRAAVSSFGFGGTNGHIVLEEHRGGGAGRAPGGQAWPAELVMLAAGSREALAAEVDALAGALAAGAAPRLRDLAFTAARRADAAPARRWVLGVVVRALDELADALAGVAAHLARPEARRLPDGCVLAEGVDAAPGEVALVFPGQGAQSPGMGREPSLYLSAVRDALARADGALRDRLPRPLSTYLFPPAAFDDEGRQRVRDELTAPAVAQPAIGALSLGVAELLGRLGVAPDHLFGHSYGELTALCAAGALPAEAFVRLSHARGRAMAEGCGRPGGMAAVFAPRDDVAARLPAGGAVVVANHNGARQTVISGPRDELDAVCAALRAARIHLRLLPVGGAFHSPEMAGAAPALRRALDEAPFAAPRRPVYSGVTVERMDADPDAIRRTLETQLTHPVEFVALVERVWSAGARVFVDVGPGATLAPLVDEALDGRPRHVVPLDGGGGMRALLLGLARLFPLVPSMRLTPLFEGRDVALLDLSALVETTRPRPLPESAWLVNGVRAWRPGDASRAIVPPAAPKETPAVPAVPAAVATASVDDADARDAASVGWTPAANGHAPPPRPAGATAADAALEAFAAYQETMRRFLATQESVVMHFLGSGAPAERVPAQAVPGSLVVPPSVRNGGNGHHAPHASPPAPVLPSRLAAAGVSVDADAPEPPAADASPSPSPDSDAPADPERLLRQLVDVVARRTGYPPEMLGADLDLESELGIDSIKRVEILEALQRLLPADVARGARDRMEQLTRIKTLRGLVAAVLPAGAPVPAAAGPARWVEAEPAGEGGFGVELDPADRFAPPPESDAVDDLASASPGEEADEEADGDEDEPVARYVMAAVPAPLPPREERAPGLVLVTGSRGGVAGTVTARLGLESRAAVLLDVASFTPEALAAEVARLRGEYGPVTHLLHLTALAEGAPAATLDGWHRETWTHAKSLFHLLRACADDLRAGGVVLAASRLGGSFGRDGGHAASPAGGAAPGLLRTAAREWPALRVRAVDFDGVPSADELARRLVDEALAPGGPPEVGYPGGARMAFRARPAPLPRGGGEDPLPAEGGVVAATGGASGITARIVAALARPGMRVFLCGRSPLPADEPPALAGVDDAGLRAHLLAAAAADGRATTPAEVEAELRRIVRARRGRRALARVAARGARVEYRAVDVRDEAAFSAWLGDVQMRAGRVDVLLHGAGVIHDRRLEEKTADSFDEVFDTKADAAFLLLAHLPPGSVGAVVLFGSVSGRFGSAGQADYAAGNELLNRAAWRMRREWPGTRVVCVNWGPWSGVGMAADAGVGEVMRRRGIAFIPPAAGCRFLLDELRSPPPGDVEVIAGEGPWNDHG